MKKYADMWGLALFFIALGILLFRAGWGADSVFAASDANVGLLSRIKQVLPEAFCGTFSPVPLFGSSIRYAMSARNLLLWAFPAPLIGDVIYPFWLVLSSWFLIAYLRLWKIDRWSCVAGALSAFWTGSVTLASSGHINKPAVAFFFILSLFLFEKSVRAEALRVSIGFALLCGGSVGFMLLEQQDVGVYAAVFLGPYMLLRLVQQCGRRWQKWLEILLPVIVVGLMICGPAALRAYDRNVSSVGESRQDGQAKWEFITQWSFPPAEWPDLIAPGYTGWSTGNPDGPYWGKIGRSAEWETTRQGFQNFRLDSLYIGAVPLILALFGWGMTFRKISKPDDRCRVMFFLGAASLIALWLAMGKFSPLYRVFYQLPLVNNVRAPVKFMHNLQMMAGILTAFGMSCLLQGLKDERGRMLWKRWLIVVASAGGLMLLVSVFSADEARFAEWGQYSGMIAERIRGAWMHAGIMVLLFAGGMFAARRMRVMTLLPLLVAVLLVFDSFYLTSHYFKADDFRGVRKGNPVIDYLKENQADGRVFLFSTEGVYNQWLAMDFPYHRIQAFNVWQMPRMTALNRDFLSTVGRDWKKMIDLASVRYALAPAGVFAQIQKNPDWAGSFKPVMAYRFVSAAGRVQVQQIPRVEQASDQILLEVSSSLPKMTFFSDWECAQSGDETGLLTRAEFDLHRRVIVSSSGRWAPTAVPQPGRSIALEDVSQLSHGMEGRVVSETGGVVLYTQYFEPGWHVYVDDVPAELLRCNALSMGVEVPSGEHTIRFECPKSYVNISLQAAGMALALSGLVLIGVRRK